MSLDPNAPAFQALPRQTERKKATPSGEMKTNQNAEISLLKQELVIAKTKMMQLETENKDLVRKSNVLADTIKMYESDQTQELRNRYFGNPASSASSVPSPTPGLPQSRLSTSCNTSVGSQTIDRLLNFLLDIIQSPAVTTPGLSTSSPEPSGVQPSAVPPSSQVSQSSSTEPSPGPPNPEPGLQTETSASVSTKVSSTKFSSTASATPCDPVPFSSSQVAETSSPLPNDTSSTLVQDEDMEITIDEFMPNAPEDPSRSQVHLNSNHLTTQ